MTIDHRTKAAGWERAASAPTPRVRAPNVIPENLLSGRPGATQYADGHTSFVVWAPAANAVELVLFDIRDSTPLPLHRADRGYHYAVVDGLAPGARYKYRLNGASDFPDPASLCQPDGVHHPSQVYLPNFEWTDAEWRGLPLSSYVIYELHTGAFTPEGTFEAIIPRLADLKRLGVTAIELMPVAQFPGSRNWGYDGAYPYAAQNSYGGPAGLARLVNAAHREGLAVVLDVVYNHLGPEGNYLRQFGDYFTERYRTPWGDAINFDGQNSDEVRRFFIENALYWITDLHVDALRLDAVHSIFDFSAVPFLSELAGCVHDRGRELGRPVWCIAESDVNDPRLISPRSAGGLGLDAQWADDFHHALHAALTGERTGYYSDFGEASLVAAAMRDPFVYGGQYSLCRRRRHGASAAGVAGKHFVVCSQNHDQVGNRAFGERLCHLLPFEAPKLAAACVILSPFLPLLFMGEEYAETAPFLYFTSHSEPDLIEAVRHGRRSEFAAFQWKQEVPAPDEEATFERSKLHWNLREEAEHRVMLEFYTELLRLRREVPALSDLAAKSAEVDGFNGAKYLSLRRTHEGSETFALFNFRPRHNDVLPVPFQGIWRRVLASADERWGGPGTAAPSVLDGARQGSIRLAPYEAVLFVRQE